MQKNFNHLLTTIKDLAQKDLSRCVKTLNKVESTLLHFQIRGIKVMSYVCGMDTITMKFTTKSKMTKKDIVEYVENVVNDLEEPRKDLEVEIIDDVDDISFTETYRMDTPVELYYHEMNHLPKPPVKNKRKEIEAKLNTIANGFHLINSVMSICDEDGDHTEKYTISDLNHPLRHKCEQPVQFPRIAELMPKRLRSQISSLQNSKSLHPLLGGEIRVSAREQRVNYVISAGTNFTAVELGLDMNNQPVAVKRIPRQSWVGRIMKTLVDPLIGFVDNHLLHYFLCEYDPTELILVTPLCKWNMTQYVQLLRHSSSTTIISPGTIVQMIREFLNGLMVLHKCVMPTVHGNLKPSNVFIDFNGLVKIGEFGIYKALYKIIEAPKSSLIWFSKETLEIYMNSSIVECSFKSDIQVAGMLVYFITTFGKHPFGDDTDEILNNIQKGSLKMKTKNLDLKDLLTWMLTTDPHERPNVDQVLSHPFFWSPSKKWSFILSCAGINQTGYILPINVDKLHRNVDNFCDSYGQYDWHQVITDKFPTVRIAESNTVVGLLQFIKNCHEYRMEINISDTELCCGVMSAFPTLPVTLYRTLQNTNWFKHTVFVSFGDEEF